MFGISGTRNHVFVKVDVESYECKLVPSLERWLSKFVGAKPTFWLSMHSQIASCDKEDYLAVARIAKTYRFVSAGFILGDTVATSGEFALSDIKPPFT
jgi:hypothetical protein